MSATLVNHPQEPTRLLLLIKNKGETPLLHIQQWNYVPYMDIITKAKL